MEPGSVIITGAGSGIGRQTALHFAHEMDYQLILMGRSIQKLEQTIQLCEKFASRKPHGTSVDLGDEKAVQKITVPDYFPPLKGIIHIAGGYLEKPLKQTDSDDLGSQMRINFYSAFFLNQKFLPNLIQQDRAFLIHTGSSASFTGIGKAAAYVASKHALLGYVRSLRDELKGTNVSVSIVHPGSTWTESWEGSGVDPNLLIDANDISKTILMISGLSARSVVEEINITPRSGNI